MKNHMRENPSANALKYALLLMGTAMFLWPSAAQAADVSLDCDANLGPDNAYVSAALVSGDRVTITGTCELNQGLTIQSLTNLTIQGSSLDPANVTPTATIRLPLAGSCAPDAPAGGFFNRPVLNITDSRGITLRGLLIEGGSQDLALADSQVTLQGVTVEDTRGTGIGLTDSSINLQGAFQGRTPSPESLPMLVNSPNTVRNNCGAGINASGGSSVGISLQNTTSGNVGRGITLGGGSNANLNACCTPVTNDPAQITIENNFRGIQAGTGGFANINGGADGAGNPGTILIQNNAEWGLNAFGGGSINVSGQTIVQNNSLAPQSAIGIAPPAGVFIRAGGSVFVNPGAQILNNSGPGIEADLQGIITLGNLPPPPGSPPPVFTGVTISGNQAEGVRLLHMSIAESFAGNTISGNLGTADVTCDGSSWLVGNVTGIGTIKCANTEQTKKK